VGSDAGVLTSKPNAIAAMQVEKQLSKTTPQADPKTLGR
jgi:hypothetical protein